MIDPLRPEIPMIIKDLIALSGLSPSRIAESAGLHRTGVLRWLKGGSDLGEKAQEKLFLTLGGFGGTLSPHIVHSWVLKRGDLAPLVNVLKWVNRKPHGFAMVYFVPGEWNRDVKNIINGKNNIFPINLIKFPLLIRSIDQLSPSPIRIVLRRFPSHLVPIQNIQNIGILIDAKLTRWLRYDVDIEMSSEEEQSLYKKFTENNLSVQEYDQFWNKLEDAANKTDEELVWKSITWEDLISWSEEKGIGPGEALKYICEKHENLGKNPSTRRMDRDENKSGG